MNRLTAIQFPSDPTQNVTFTYDSTQVTYGIGRLTGRTDPSGSYTFYYDVNGNLTKEEKTITQAIAWKAAYTPFGKAVTSIATIENPFRFPGQYYDPETGLHYNYFRYYNPQIGRYIAPDPIGLEGGINLFLYVGGNPLNQFDPLGLFESYWFQKWIPASTFLISA